jgi:hypothetical protein
MSNITIPDQKLQISFSKTRKEYFETMGIIGKQ